MARYMVWVPVRFGGMVREHRTEVEYDGLVTPTIVEEMRRVAVDHVKGKRLEVVDGQEIKVNKKPPQRETVTAEEAASAKPTPEKALKLTPTAPAKKAAPSTSKSTAAPMSPTQLECIRYMHRHGGHVAQGEGFTITVVRKLEAAGIVTIHKYVTDMLYEARGKTWIACLTRPRIDMAQKFDVEIPYGFREWFRSTRLIEPFTGDKLYEDDMTRAIRDTWRESSRTSAEAGMRGDMKLTAPLSVLTAIAAMADGPAGRKNPYNKLDPEDRQEFLDAVSRLV
ncbi:hypothetical protein [Streptomyces sp. NPDC002855]|uniref:hypothetical protein n=1 Tax=Streptomyces sp. NPDC002855 TaxID=3154437 RepID=UPI00332921FA